MTEIIKIKGDWEEVVDDCRATMGKGPLGKAPSRSWRRRILIAEHEPIRDITIKWRWARIPYWVAMHWKTHIWRCRTISQRNDRQSGYDRNAARQDAPVTLIGDANPQHLIDTMRKRLCRKASPETRACAEDLKRKLQPVEPEIADMLVPNCVYRCGCPEMEPCGLWERMLKETDDAVASMSISRRYDAYNEWWEARQ